MKTVIQLMTALVVLFFAAQSWGSNLNLISVPSSKAACAKSASAHQINQGTSVAEEEEEELTCPEDHVLCKGPQGPDECGDRCCPETHPYMNNCNCRCYKTHELATVKSKCSSATGCR